MLLLRGVDRMMYGDRRVPAVHVDLGAVDPARLQRRDRPVPEVVLGGARLGRNEHSCQQHGYGEGREQPDDDRPPNESGHCSSVGCGQE